MQQYPASQTSRADYFQLLAAKYGAAADGSDADDWTEADVGPLTENDEESQISQSHSRYHVNAEVVSAATLVPTNDHGRFRTGIYGGLQSLPAGSYEAVHAHAPKGRRSGSFWYKCNVGKC